MKRDAWSVVLFVFALAGCGGGGDTHEVPDYGAPCGTGVACAAGLACLPTPDGHGYCTTTCDTATCPTGTTCNSAFGASVCFSACTSDSSCHTGEQCWSGLCQPACGDEVACGGNGATCVSGRCHGPECTMASDCNGAQTCVSGHCVATSDGGTPVLPDGTACTSSASCASGLCLPAARGGVCTIACTNGDACNSEPWIASCGVATIDGTFGTFCVPLQAQPGNGAACTSDAGCSNLTCVASQCRDVCTADTQCIRGQTCTSVAYTGGGTFMGCGYAPGPASGTEVRVVPLGDFVVPANSGTPDIVFATPPETISVTLRAVQTAGDPLDMYFYQVSDAAAQVFSLDQMSMYVDQPIRWYPFDASSAVAMLIPNTTTDRYTYHPGAMHFTMAAYPVTMGAGGSVTMHVDALEMVGAAPTAGTLHLRIHLVGVGITAATAATNSRITSFLNRFEAIVSMVGITVADVSYVDIDAPALDIIDTADGEDSELSQLFRMSTTAGTDMNVINLFLVQQVRAGDSGEFNTLGIAGGIPGPARVQGSSHSGVVIAFDPGVVGNGNAGGDLAGHVAAHECGHFLGLFHTTENGRACGAGETPSATDTCVPFGGTDVIGDTTYMDATNLMHFVIQGNNWHMTAGQGFVELRNPLTR